MRKILEWVQRGVGLILEILGGLLMFDGPKDIIATARSILLDLNLTPPPWLDDSHEQRIVRWLVGIMIFLIGFLALWPSITILLLACWRKIWDLTTIGQIARKLPHKMIPPNGDWLAANERANVILKRFENRGATIQISVKTAYHVIEGQYRGCFVIMAQPTNDHRTGLYVVLHTYFDGATLDQIIRVRDLKTFDASTIDGTITRVHINHRPDADTAGRWCINIDMNRCTLI